MLEMEILLIFWLEEIEILTKLIERKIQGKWIMKKENINFFFYFILFYFCIFALSQLPNTALSIQLKSNQTNHGVHQMPKHYLHHHTHIPISQLPPYPTAATISGHSGFWDGFSSRPYSVKSVVGLEIVKQIYGI